MPPRAVGTPKRFTPHAHLPCTHIKHLAFIPLIHTSQSQHTYQTPPISTSHVGLTPSIHTSHSHLPFTHPIHTPHAHLPCTSPFSSFHSHCQFTSPIHISHAHLPFTTGFTRRFYQEASTAQEAITQTLQLGIRSVRQVPKGIHLPCTYTKHLPFTPPIHTSHVHLTFTDGSAHILFSFCVVCVTCFYSYSFHSHLPCTPPIHSWFNPTVSTRMRPRHRRQSRRLFNSRSAPCTRYRNDTRHLPLAPPIYNFHSHRLFTPRMHTSQSQHTNHTPPMHTSHL